MKKKTHRVLAIICSLALLVCTCYVCDSLLNEERAVVREYKSRLRQAVWSNDLVGIKVARAGTVTDPEQIEQWLSVLKKIKVECVTSQMVYGSPTYVTFLYPEEEVVWGSYISTGKNEARIYVPDTEDYMLRVVNWEDVGEELNTLWNIAWKNALQNEAQK